MTTALQPAPVVEEKKSADDEMPQINPDEMAGSMDMMKQSMLGIVPQMLSIGWVSYFFSGFVLSKAGIGVLHPFLMSFGFSEVTFPFD
jgi:hypothetical protein